MPESRRIRCKTEGCNWSVPSFYQTKTGKTANGWVAYAGHLATCSGLQGHPQLSVKQLERIARGFEPGRAATPAEDER